MAESLALLIRHQKVSLGHLTEFRKGVEGDIAALASQRAETDDIVCLETLLQKAREYAEKGTDCTEEFLEVDKTIHLTLARITGNPVYASVEQIVQENIIPYYETRLKMEARRLRENCNDLKGFVEAVKLGHAEEARLLTKKHVAKFSIYMEEKAR